ncbi:MAG TPA: hypothetical protein VFV05_16160, partial [Methylomirabilota bacterium]|nr:hypothetical protein [Methylomirabilota bacterium]
DSAVDDYETFATGDGDGGTDDPGYIAAKQVFDAIEPLRDPQAGTGPRVTWEALAERVYGAGERTLMRAVMTSTPPAYTISIVGAQQ